MGRWVFLRRNTLRILYADLCRYIVGVMENIIQCNDSFLPQQLFHERLSLLWDSLFIYTFHTYQFLCTKLINYRRTYKHSNTYSRALCSNKKDNKIFSYTLPSVFLYVLPLYFKEMKDGL